MTNNSNESIAGIMDKTWKLDLLNVTQADNGNLVNKTVVDLNSPEFISVWGGYAPIQLVLFQNHSFKAVYQIDGNIVNASGKWSIKNNNIVLTQSSGDDILLTNAVLQGDVLSSGYEYLSSDYGINKLVFKQK